MDPKPSIERNGSLVFVVVPQRVGAPLRFQCESERDALHFLHVFDPRPPHGSVGNVSSEPPLTKSVLVASNAGVPASGKKSAPVFGLRSKRG